MLVSGFRAMWVIVLFDLPVSTKPERRRATEFRKALLQDGFTRMQYSVYMRPCASEEGAVTHRSRIRAVLPPRGAVRILLITDRQFSRILCFDGKDLTDPERMPTQLEFF